MNDYEYKKLMEMKEWEFQQKWDHRKRTVQQDKIWNANSSKNQAKSQNNDPR